MKRLGCDAPEETEAQANANVTDMEAVPRMPAKNAKAMVLHARVGGVGRLGLARVDWSDCDKIAAHVCYTHTHTHTHTHVCYTLHTCVMTQIAKHYHINNNPARPKRLRPTTLKKTVEDEADLVAARSATPIKNYRCTLNKLSLLLLHLLHPGKPSDSSSSSHVCRKNWSSAQKQRFAKLYATKSKGTHSPTHSLTHPLTHSCTLQTS